MVNGTHKDLGIWPALFPDVPSLNVESDGDDLQSNQPIAVVRVGGMPGVGKSMFGLRIVVRPPGSKDRPVRYFDYEGSATSYKSQYAMDYHDMRSYSSLVDAYEAFMATVKAMKPGENCIAIIDPAEEWEETIQEWLLKNPKHYGRQADAYFKNGYIQPLFWGDLKRKAKEDLMLLLQKVQLIVLVNHLSLQYVNNKPVPGKYKLNGKDVLRKLSTIEAVLMGDGTKAPAAVITRSRLNFNDWEGVDLDVDPFALPACRPLLPTYIPEFTAPALRDYLKNPRKKFTKTESQKIDPWTYVTSDAERMVLENEINTQRLQLAAQEREAEKNRLIADLIRVGYFANNLEIKEAAGTLGKTGLTYEKNPDEFIAGLMQYSRDKWPERVLITDPVKTADPVTAPVD